MNEKLLNDILKFRDDRNWKQFHNSKDLAISLQLEASELLENFQWKSSTEAEEANREDIADELADVLMYGVLLADSMGFDLEEVIKKKLEKNKQKYPVSKAYGNKTKYTKL